MSTGRASTRSLARRWSPWFETPLPDGPGPPGSIRPLIISTIAVGAIAIMAYSGLADIIRRPDRALVKSDFAAFYCGAVVTRAHADPYALAGLRQCETTQVDQPGGIDPASVAIDPDPVPGYDMAFFMPFTMLRYRTAALLWDAILLAAMGATVALLVTQTRIPGLVIAAIIAYAGGVTSVPYGQLPPLLTVGIALAGYGLSRQRVDFTLIGAAIAMLEPHIGIPLGLALFVWRPVLRWPLIAGAAALLLASLAVAGAPISIEYVRVALPAHVAAEATTAIQYSLAWLLHYLGLAERPAIALSSAQYIITVAASIVLAGPVARRMNAPAALAFFPPVMALVGGPYIHLQQMEAALPFALLATTRLSGIAVATVWLAVGLLAVPWPLPARLLTCGAIFLAVSVGFAALRSVRLSLATSGAVLAGAIYLSVAGPLMRGAVPAFPQHILAPTAPMPRALDGGRLAAEEDALEMRGSLTSGFAVSTPRTLAAKIPTWLALFALVGAALAGTPVRAVTIVGADVRSSQPRRIAGANRNRDAADSYRDA